MRREKVAPKYFKCVSIFRKGQVGGCNNFEIRKTSLFKFESKIIIVNDDGQSVASESDRINEELAIL